jgi:HK97 family phage portal protein
VGFWDRVLSSAGQALRIFEPSTSYLGLPAPMGDMVSLSDALGGQILGMSVRTLWRKQPHLRTVVSFRAENVAQLGLHAFTMAADGSRVRDRDGLVPRLLEWVDGRQTMYRLLYALSADLDLYDRAFIMVVGDPSSPVGWSLRRVPPMWVSVVQDGPFGVDHFEVSSGSSTVSVPPEAMLYFDGYDPDDPLGSSPAIESLRQTLNEQVQAALYRAQVWEKGGRVSSVLQRPAGAPRWSDAAREAFRADWHAKYTGRGKGSGGTPILEDGMTLQRIDFNAQEQQFVEAAKLSLQTVASAFHVDPTMIGSSDSATFSNVKAFRKMLYTESLGPTLTRIEQLLNRDLMAKLGVSGEFVEFNIREKLAGDFEESAAVLSASTGGPWMTRNEARQRENLPPIEGGDELITPMNVTSGGQASPRDTGSQNENPSSDQPDRAENSTPEIARKNLPKIGVKAWRVSRKDAGDDEKDVSDVLVSFFDRQGRSVLSKLGSGADEWWDADRWNGELADDIVGQMKGLSVDSAHKMLADHGIDPSTYDVDRTVKFLQVCARDRAEAINASVKDDLDAAVEDPEADPVDVYGEDRTGNRAAKIAVSVVAFAGAFGAIESARQQGGPGVTKTWVVTSGNPRESHAAMDGETVPVDEQFSNGLDWPGSFGDPDEVAGCTCEVDLNFPD